LITAGNLISIVAAATGPTLFFRLTDLFMSSVQWRALSLQCQLFACWRYIFSSPICYFCRNGNGVL